MPILGGTGSIPVPNFFLTTFLSKSRGMWAAKGIRDTVAFPLQPDMLIAKSVAHKGPLILLILTPAALEAQ